VHTTADKFTLLEGNLDKHPGHLARSCCPEAANVLAAVMNDDDTNVAAVVAVPDDAAARFANVGGDVNGSTIHHNHNGINTGDTRKKDTSHVLPACNSFLRRCLYETIKGEYPGLILERADIQNASWNAGVIGGGKDQIRVIRLKAL
jgi:hypothetical protein